jgi:hypothetical protein
VDEPEQSCEESVRSAATEKDRIIQATEALWRVIDYHTAENYMTNETWIGIIEGIKFKLLKRWHGDDEPEEDWKL